MTTAMGPPPPRKPDAETVDPPTTTTATTTTLVPTGLLSAKTSNPPESQTQTCDDSQSQQHGEEQEQAQPNTELSSVVENGNQSSTLEDEGQGSVAAPYTIPPWSEPPCYNFYLEVLKDGSIIDQYNLSEKGAYMFGRIDLCDFVLEHPTISRFHAVLQFKKNGDAFLYDLGSTHGTYVNKCQVKKKLYVELHVGDVIRFGHSSRLYIFQGPANLMPPETDLKIIRDAKIYEKIQDREASLQRVRLQKSLADGISWGMKEDAIEEAEDYVDEITWQTYKGQLTEKQEKTRDKVIKRMQKITHMKKEIAAIRAKDITQGGLTQGQQTQIARNEQRISQLMEELENLEETLNESIRESLGARTGKLSRSKKNGAVEDDLSSDDDEFYDRTKKTTSIEKSNETQSVETADTLLDKKDAISKEIEDKTRILLDEKSRLESENNVGTEGGDVLDSYMSGLSSQLVLDRIARLEKELSTLQSDLDRVVYLLKYADPTGEAAKKRDSTPQQPRPNTSEISILPLKKLWVEKKKTAPSKKPANESSEKPEAGPTASVTTESRTAVYAAAKPQWLGATEEKQRKETQLPETPTNMPDSDEFVDYKDRKQFLGPTDDNSREIERAAPGLILRKRKLVEKPVDTVPSTSGAAEDAVALLLKHSRGLCVGADEEDGENEKNSETFGRNQSDTDKRPKRVFGPEKPSFLDVDSVDYESWVPPEGQSGDGRTSLNDRYGY